MAIVRNLPLAAPAAKARSRCRRRLRCSSCRAAPTLPAACRKQQHGRAHQLPPPCGMQRTSPPRQKLPAARLGRRCPTSSARRARCRTARCSSRSALWTAAGAPARAAARNTLLLLHLGLCNHLAAAAARQASLQHCRLAKRPAAVATAGIAVASQRTAQQLPQTATRLQAAPHAPRAVSTSGLRAHREAHSAATASAALQQVPGRLQAGTRQRWAAR